MTKAYTAARGIPGGGRLRAMPEGGPEGPRGGLRQLAYRRASTYTDKWPVLHAGSVPAVDLATWDFRASAWWHPLRLSFDAAA